MSTRAQAISLTIGTMVFVALTGLIWFSTHAARAKEEKAAVGRTEVDLKRLFLVHNVTDPEPEKTLRTVMSGGFFAIGEEVIDLPTLATELTTDSRYSGVDVVLVKTSDDGSWGEFLRIRSAVQASGREVYFYRSDGPCECTEHDLVIHTGIGRGNTPINADTELPRSAESVAR